MELTVQNVYGLLLRSRLLPADEVRALFERWQKEAGGAAGNLTQFARWLVANRYLTEYQVGLLSRGHADGFFLNQYKILNRLGKGRMAGVYDAVHETGQRVAIKVLPPSKARDAHLLARFQREARLALKLMHPNVVRSFQVGLAGELHYLVMEHLEGETLEEVLQRRGKLPPAEAVRLIHQALLGLQHLHEQGLVHRDLKPANLMLVPAPAPGQPDTTVHATVKILDIGLGRPMYDETEPDRTVDDGLTGEGAVLGTPDYMAPEQARDARTVDIRSDIYSLGCVLYHALAGQPPFPDRNLLSQMIRHATEAPRPLKEFNPAVPDGLQQIVNWMLAKDPAQRYPTPERAAQALQVFLAAGAEPAASPLPDAQMSSYLVWLEDENSRTDLTAVRPATGTLAPAPSPVAPPRPPSVTIPAAVPVKPPQATLPAGPSSARPAAQPKPKKAKPGVPADKAKRQARRHKHRQAAALAASLAAAGAAAPPPAVVVSDFDVELVPAEPAAPAPFRLSRRDLLMFGVGVTGTLLAIGFSWLLAHLLTPRPPAGPGDSTRE